MRYKEITPKDIKYIEEAFCGDEPKFRSGAGARSEVQVSPIEGKLIQIIVKMIQAKRVLEIGAMYGYSTAWMLSAMPDDGELLSIEKSREAYDIAVENVGKDKRVHILNKDAKDVLPELGDGIYDMVFIDANKSAYSFYLEQATRLLRKGGVLVADDALLFSEVWLNCNSSELSSMEKGVCEFNSMLANSRFFLGLTIPVFHGLAVAVRI